MASKSNNTNTAPGSILRLPDELLSEICTHCTLGTLSRLRLTCHRLNQIASLFLFSKFTYQYGAYTQDLIWLRTISPKNWTTFQKLFYFNSNAQRLYKIMQAGYHTCIQELSIFENVGGTTDLYVTPPGIDISCGRDPDGSWKRCEKSGGHYCVEKVREMSEKHVVVISGVLRDGIKHGRLKRINLRLGGGGSRNDVGALVVGRAQMEILATALREGLLPEDTPLADTDETSAIAQKRRVGEYNGEFVLKLRSRQDVRDVLRMGITTMLTRLYMSFLSLQTKADDLLALQEVLEEISKAGRLRQLLLFFENSIGSNIQHSLRFRYLDFPKLQQLHLNLLTLESTTELVEFLRRHRGLTNLSLLNLQFEDPVVDWGSFFSTLHSEIILPSLTRFHFAVGGRGDQQQDVTPNDRKYLGEEAKYWCKACCDFEISVDRRRFTSEVQHQQPVRDSGESEAEVQRMLDEKWAGKKYDYRCQLYEGCSLWRKCRLGCGPWGDCTIEDYKTCLKGRTGKLAISEQ